MLFSSIEFLFLFLPLTLILYYSLPFKFRNAVLFVMSVIFYGWGEPLYLFLMLAVITGDYAFGYAVGSNREKNKRKAKRYVALSVCFNLALLMFFKYYGFIEENINALVSFSLLPELDIELPIGISFYIFQALSYVIDVYRGDADKAKNPLVFGTYVTLYPQLIAGPIVRYKDVEEQLVKRLHGFDKIASGIRLFIVGLAKKVILADTAGAMWSYFAGQADSQRSALGAWLGVLFYSFQIYFDFSGYSDMARGLGRMIGFEFLINFDYPYISKSITEFWRRWHISLGTWFREYVYIPLGGNRCSRFKNIRNILLVWLLTGLWHGASWNFVLWGLYYALLLIVEKFFLKSLLERAAAFVRHIYTLFLVAFGWFIFISGDIASPIGYLKSMFGFGAGLVTGSDTYDTVRSLTVITVCVIASTPAFAGAYRALAKKYSDKTFFKTAELVCALMLFALSLAFMVSADYSPFLYFRF